MIIKLLKRLFLSKEQRELADLLEGRRVTLTRRGIGFSEHFAIEPDMVSTNAVRINTSSFRKWLASEEGKLKSGGSPNAFKN